MASKVLHKMCKRTGSPNIEANLFESILNHPCIMKMNNIINCSDEKTKIRIELELQEGIFDI